MRRSPGERERLKALVNGEPLNPPDENAADDTAEPATDASERPAPSQTH